MADEAASRALLLDSGTAEAVTVNQRALIDKILARYSSEFTVFRELIQNADDAGAETCELRFNSQEYNSASNEALEVPNLKATLRSWMFRNNGKAFNGDDWNRLRRIAEGNPDPDRIGAFGVGFYSLFSISEEPIVSSGAELMGFFWKDDSLFTRRAKSPNAELSPNGQPWTTFHMPLREPAPFSDSFLDLSRFLATSLTFTSNVRRLALYFDDRPLCRLHKVLEPAKTLVMPSHLNATSPRKMLKVQSMDTTAMRLDVEAMKLVTDLAEKPKPALVNLASAFSKTGGGGLASMLQSAFGRSKEKEPKVITPATPSPAVDTASKAASALTTTSATVHVRIATATTGVSVDRAFEREIERSTKKPPPKVTKLQVIAQNKQESEASKEASHGGDIAEIFKGIVPSLDTQGHVFIGFRTTQTTSFTGHLAARFIPTVERESIDFVDKYCAQWNNELLAMGGYVTRAVYEAEMAEIGKVWTEKLGSGRPKDDDQLAKDLLERALHVMRFFTFRRSTPSPRVHDALETAFFGCARQNTLTLASTRGVKHSALVRFPNAVLADFVKDLAVIPPSHVEQAGEFIAQVKSRGLVREITMDDVFSELSGRALSIEEMISCLKWWVTVANHPSYDPTLLRQLLNNALVDVPVSKDGKEASVQQLAGVKSFLNPQRVPTDVPLPPSCLTYEVSKALSSQDMSRIFGWGELTVAQWIEHVAVLSRAKDANLDTNIQLSPPFAEKVMGIVARAWGSLPTQQLEAIHATLKDLPCIPTRKGMTKPGESYFANVSLFDDLPIVSFPTQIQIKGNLEKALAALGVRRHVELQMIFDRLVAAGDWDVTQLVTYLASNKDTLSTLELERLTKTAMFPKAGEVGPPGKDGKPRIVRYRASQLYEPTDTLKALKLPLLDWPGKVWRSNSEEAKFAYELGLRKFPPLEEVLRLASSNNEDEQVRKRAFAYLLDKVPTTYKNTYSLKSAASFAFIPCKTPEGNIVLKKPTEAFTNKEAVILGFPSVSDEVGVMDVAKLGLRSNPSNAQIVAKLVNEPSRDIQIARKVFEYLSSVTELTMSDYKLLSTACFIPVKRSSNTAAAASTPSSQGEKNDIILTRPVETYFGDKSTNSQLKDVLNEVFVFVDFGERASVFLRNCGVSKEPSIEEVAVQLVRDPQRFFRIAGVENYLGILRQIATNWQRIPYTLRNEMKRSKFALASKRISVAKQSQPNGKAGEIENLMDADLDEDDNDEQGVLIHDLKRPDEIVIVDDAASQMLFSEVVFAVPHEDLIEAMMAELGVKRLSTLVEEKYAAAGQVRFDTQRCVEVAGIVLERTPLFIFEKRQSSKSEVRRDAEWLKSHLQLAQVDGRGLRLTRQLRFGSINVSNEQRCSAMASLQSGKLTLYIAENMEVDWYEVAMALAKHLLSRQTLPDMLLYMTILSTSLRNLKRRGFHVDKILSQRKAEREATERAMREERAKAELEAAQRPSEGQIKQWTNDMLAVFPDADPTYVERLLRETKTDHVVNATNSMLERPYPKAPPKRPAEFGADPMNNSKAVAVAGKQDLSIVAPQPPTDFGDSRGSGSGSGGGFFSNWRNRLRGSEGDSGSPNLPGGWQPGQTKHQFPEALTAALQASSTGQVRESIAGSVSAGNTTTQATARNPNAGVTPSANIKRRVLSAIDASRGSAPNSFNSPGQSIESQGHQTRVKEAQSTYCDTTGVAMSLRLAGQISNMNVYVSPELDPSSTLTNNGQAMQLFIDRIIKPIIGVFNLDIKSVHIFVDVTGPSIAFNRAGQLFLNFRYHLVWFDEEVRQGQYTNALISTYHSLAHELAHNLVAQHDSEHEFWFSSICEQYFVPFAAIVAQASAASSGTAKRQIEAA